MSGKGYQKLILMLIFLIFDCSLNALELMVEPQDEVIPGTAVAIIVNGVDGKSINKIKVTANGREIPLWGDNNGRLSGLYGVDLNERGVIELTAYDGNSLTKKSIKVKEWKFEIERLTLPPEKVFLSEEDLKRADAEKAKLDEIWSGVTMERFWYGKFVVPATGREGSAFGLRRIINGEERSPHTGRDVVAEEGSPVIAINRGRVVFVGELFFGGNSIIIDHGLGLYSMYFHLSDMVVHEGKMVDKGELIGHIGATGRASGPHLHWGVRLLGARVDPQSLLRMELLNEIN